MCKQTPCVFRLLPTTNDLRVMLNFVKIARCKGSQPGLLNPFSHSCRSRTFLNVSFQNVFRRPSAQKVNLNRSFHVTERRCLSANPITITVTRDFGSFSWPCNPCIKCSNCRFLSAVFSNTTSILWPSSKKLRLSLFHEWSFHARHVILGRQNCRFLSVVLRIVR